MRTFCSIVLSLMFCLSGFAVNAAEMEPLRIGVRADATSMSYKVNEDGLSGEPLAGPLRKQGYSGYMVYLCDRVLIELEREYGKQLMVTAVPVSAFERFNALDRGDIDILCGPTTATKDRLEGRISSPPVFISGLSYAIRPAAPEKRCSTLIGYVKSTTAGTDGIVKILEAGKLPLDKPILMKYIRGDVGWTEAYSDCPRNSQQLPVSKPIAGYDNHQELARAFCKDEVRYYVGDFEIVSRTLLGMSECKFTISNSTFSEERYVILGNAKREDGASPALVAHFFEVLSRQIFFKPSLLDEAFEATFKPAKRSRKLSILYWALRGNR